MAIARRENGTTETVIARRKEDEDGTENPDGSEGPRELTGPSAPLECGIGEKNSTAAVPIGDEESRLRGAERYRLPRFIRSVAESGTWAVKGPGIPSGGGETAIARRENGTTEMAIARRKEDEDGTENPDGSEGPRELTGPSAPLECGMGEKNRTAAVPIGDEESRLRGAERYYPPRFRRSVA
ncbi:hypothetical protein NDU88_006750 [Pleurodeles waltl]|uniref:Uncharacterized protein n=1 Tax=Pleurodeles waltl TaxID=8319 RepID=A0AAV7L6Q0_PLEWA|nr:hypothetical protein NDU88_006750 [Pleurodeles waltl]